MVAPTRGDCSPGGVGGTAHNAHSHSPGGGEDKLKPALNLESVLSQMDVYLNTQLSGAPYCLVTDGPLPLRQVLHPEATKKCLTLPSYFYAFYDLRKEFRRCYRNADMRTVEDMLTYLSITAVDLSEDFILGRLQNIASILSRLLADGHEFDEVETINDKLEPGICSKHEFVDNNTVVRARGLPWQSSDQDIANFFKGLNIVKGGVALCLSVQGRRNGEALVRFANQEHRDMALRRHKHHIGQRYIEVYRASGEDFLNVAGGSNNEAHTFLSRGAQAIVRMRGLPYDSSAQQVIDFFSTNDPCPVLHAEEGVLFVRKPDGRPTGDAFVLFETEEVATRALAKHRESMGTRYIELFRSTTAEVQQVFNRNMDTGGSGGSRGLFESAMAAAAAQQAGPLLSGLSGLVSQPLLHPGPSRKDCIRLRGLPYEAQVEQILEFLGEHSKKIVFQGVHMVYNSQGQPSGEAFIQMDSEGSAQMASQGRHHRYMAFGKKQRYIEVFQCSVDDMNLTGGINLQRPGLLPSAGPLLPPFGPFGPFAGLGHAGNPVSAAGLSAAGLSGAGSHPALAALNGATTPGAVSLAAMGAHHHQQAAVVAAAAAAAGGRAGLPGGLPGSYPANPFNLFYWHYPSPPVSPTAYFAAQQTPAQSLVNLRALR